MKKLCRKGYLAKSGKRWLALLMSIFLIGTMLPILVRAESGITDTGSTETGLCEHHTEHTPECGYAEGSEGSPCTFLCDICGKEAEPGEGNPPETVEGSAKAEGNGSGSVMKGWISTVVG